MTPEEKRAETKKRKEQELAAALLKPGSMSGARSSSQSITQKPITTIKAFDGLEVSEVYNKPLSWFKPDPENEEFEALKAKRPGYWEDLKRDIEKVGVLTPLLATSGGLVLQGHSRLKIAQELGLSRLPVCLVETPLSPEEIKTRRRLDNLLRFEIDSKTRLLMLAEIWPDFYLTEGKAGRPGKESGNGYTITAPELAKKLGVSQDKVKQDKAKVIKAKKIADSKNEPLSLTHIEEVTEQKNQTRREKTGKTSQPSAAEKARTEIKALVSTNPHPAYLKGIRDLLNILAASENISQKLKDEILKNLEEQNE